MQRLRQQFPLGLSNHSTPLHAFDRTPSGLSHRRKDPGDIEDCDVLLTCYVDGSRVPNYHYHHIAVIDRIYGITGTEAYLDVAEWGESGQEKHWNPGEHVELRIDKHDESVYAVPYGTDKQHDLCRRYFCAPPQEVKPNP